MSESSDQPPAAPPASVTGGEATPTGTSYELVQRLKAEKKSREDIIAALKAAGHDDEAAKVLVNSVMGAMPSELPSAQLSPGTNALSPGVFALSDIGLTGPSHVVGVYWMGFGAAILVALGLGAVMTMSGLAKVPDTVAYYSVRLGGVLSMAFIAWGLFRYSQAIVIRRKP